MDNFSHSYFSDPFPYLSSLGPLEEPEASPIVSVGSSTTSRPCNLPDEAVLLASSNPKKRAGRKKFSETRHPVFRGKAAAEAAEAFRPAEREEDVKEEECGVAAWPEEAFYMDEEADFGMSGSLANLAEGLMMPPPRYVGGDRGYNYDRDELEFCAEVSLWSYSAQF
ncbi:hypothetical protein RJ640_022971 [Escallonia rubra]|uniref:Uncharacterized protein n=1 Tax=Escallonia rubra TaxID=112253 RepID=A0AA88UKP4_9ASTE|nr:hypothetical protein RJ640_022971 [Escallonia rubra]